MLSSIESKVIAGLLLVIALAGGLIWVEEGRIGSLNKTVGSLQNSVNECRAAVAESNKAIEAGNAEAARRAKVAQDALDAAKQDAKKARATAASILAKKPPKGVNLCTAASQEFDKELRRERGVK